MFFSFGNSSMATVFGVAVYGKHSGLWWHRLLIKPVYVVGNKIHNMAWWVRYRIDPQHRYHMINTGLKPRYYDIDHLMLHGMFSLLRRYVEEERGGVHALEERAQELLSETDSDMSDCYAEHGRREMEAVTIYRWWTEAYPQMQKRERYLLRLLYESGSRITWTDAGEIGGEPVSQMHFRPDEGPEIEWRREHEELEDRIGREEQEMLHRLIDIRGGLWT